MPRFVPCRVSHLTGELGERLAPAERPELWALARVAEGLFHHYAGSQARLVEELYSAFDPDRETVPATPPRVQQPVLRLFERLESLLERANFARVRDGELLRERDREVLAQLSIDADLEAVERLAVYTRGLGTKAVGLRPWRRLFRLVERRVPTFRRVAIVVRTRSDPHVLLKLFKDVPCEDLELLLPTVRVKMRLLDKLKLSGSGGAAAISAWKLLRMLYTYTPGLAKLLSVPFKILLLPIIAVVGAIYGGKTVLDYNKIRSSYVTVLAEHLYSITMASNRSVVARLATMGGEEDTKETLVAYALLRAAASTGLTRQALREQADAFVWDRYRARIAFDVDDALRKLEELELVWREDELLRAVPLDAALRKVDGAWDELFAAPSRAESRRLRLTRS